MKLGMLTRALWRMATSGRLSPDRSGTEEGWPYYGNRPPNADAEILTTHVGREPDPWRRTVDPRAPARLHNPERVNRLARLFAQEWLRPDNPEAATERLVETLTISMRAFYGCARSADERDALSVGASPVGREEWKDVDESRSPDGDGRRSFDALIQERHARLPERGGPDVPQGNAGVVSAGQPDAGLHDSARSKSAAGSNPADSLPTLRAEARDRHVPPAEDVVCKHGTAMDVHCCNCHSGFIFDLEHECPPSMADAAEMLWVVLANVSGGDWTKQSPEWQEAAARWRDNYFAALRDAAPRADEGETK